MSELIISEQHKKAVELNQKIIVSAELAQKNLWDMCVSLKTMRDDKLYKELGYSNFEDYCENEVGFNRCNAHKYISIVENINSENVSSMKHFGMTKLYLLSTISELEQAEITEKFDLESTTVKQLKAEIDKLKSEKEINQQKLSAANFKQLDAERTLKGVQEYSVELERQLKTQKNKNSELNAKVEELESRPIEVAVQEPSDNERRLQETIKALERNNIKHYDELEKQYQEDERAVRQMLEKEKQEALAQLKNEYENRIVELTSPYSKASDDVDLEPYNIYCKLASEILRKIKTYFEKHSGENEYLKRYSELKKILNTDLQI